MNNQEFADLIINYLEEGNCYLLPQQFTEFFERHKPLKVIDTRDTLISFCIVDVMCHYENYKTTLSTKLTLPNKLTINQARWILARADYNNGKHDQGIDWYEIEYAIDQWLEEGCPDYA